MAECWLDRRGDARGGGRSALWLYIRIYSEWIPHVNQEVSHVKWSAIRASDRQAVNGLIRVGVAGWQTEDGRAMLRLCCGSSGGRPPARPSCPRWSQRKVKGRSTIGGIRRQIFFQTRKKVVHNWPLAYSCIVEADSPAGGG
jgi:hypothetical protein